MHTPDDSHKSYLDMKFREDANFLCQFHPKEIKILNKYGAWMDALHNGLISPTTEEQRRFVEFCKRDGYASTEFEKIWKQVIGLRRGRELKKQQVIEAKKRNDERFSPEGIKRDAVKIRDGQQMRSIENRPYDLD